WWGASAFLIQGPSEHEAGVGSKGWSAESQTWPGRECLWFQHAHHRPLGADVSIWSWRLGQLGSASNHPGPGREMEKKWAIPFSEGALIMHTPASSLSHCA
ncbi:hypothetical protein CLAIMM_02759, partial [Cladophialophora immunda]